MFCSARSMILKKRWGMTQRNEVEAVHTEHIQKLRIIHLKAVVGDIGRGFGGHMVGNSTNEKPGSTWFNRFWWQLCGMNEKKNLEIPDQVSPSVSQATSLVVGRHLWSRGLADGKSYLLMLKNWQPKCREPPNRWKPFQKSWISHMLANLVQESWFVLKVWQVIVRCQIAWRLNSGRDC